MKKHQRDISPHLYHNIPQRTTAIATYSARLGFLAQFDQPYLNTQRTNPQDCAPTHVKLSASTSSAKMSTPSDLPPITVPMSSSSPPTPSTALHVLLTRPHAPHLSHLTRLTSTTAGLDRTLMLIQYTCHLLSSTLRTLLHRHLAILATRFAEKASTTLLPNERVIATFPAPPLPSALASLASSTAAMSALASDVRTAMRLVGLLQMWAWACAAYTEPDPDAVVRAVTWAQVLVNTAYYALEGPVYLAGKGVVRGWSEERKARWWRAASMCFGGHVGLEVVRLGRVWMLRQERVRALDNGGEEEKPGDGVFVTKEDKMRALREEERKWMTSVQINAAYAPLCVHWSMPGGFVSDTWYGLLGSWAASLYIRDAWRNSA